jgi:hypothetical protein
MWDTYSVVREKRLQAAMVIALALSLTACATQTQIKYQPPAKYQPPTQPVIIDKPQSRLFNDLVLSLQRVSAEIILQDEKTGQIQVKFNTDPENFIDCGVVSYDDQTFPAASAEQSFKYTPSNAGDKQFQKFADAKALGSSTGWALVSAAASSPKINFYQTVDLDGVSMISLIPESESKTRAMVSASYLVRRTLQGKNQDGLSSRPSSEQIIFRTGETGIFKDSTRCTNNYEHERMLLDLLFVLAKE